MIALGTNTHPPYPTLRQTKFTGSHGDPAGLTWQLCGVNLNGARASDDALDGAAPSASGGAALRGTAHHALLTPEEACTLHTCAPDALDVL